MTALDTDAIDALVQETLVAWEVPGASVALVRGEEVAYLKGFGVRELGGEAPVTPDTVFAIASVTKAFTTTAMAMLVDEQKMAWDDPVRKHVPSFHLSDSLADANVTLRDLVCHRTGLSRHDMLWYGSPWNREEIIHKIGLVKPTTSFRSTYEYQNIMYLVAGYAVGLASGGTWEEFVQKRIFDPLGMKDANFSVTVAAKTPDHATPHNRNKDEKIEVVPWRNLDNCGPCGCINASVRDLSKWVRFQLGAGVFEGKRLLSEQNHAETHAPQMVIRPDDFAKAVTRYTTQSSYCLGWSLSDYRGHRVLSHSGGIDGFRSRVSLLPQSQIGIAILSNLRESWLPETLITSLFDLLLGYPVEDWNARYREQTDKMKTEQKAKEQERAEKRHKETKPSRELAAYLGAYENLAYGTASVSLENGALTLQWSQFVFTLEHHHYDTFTAKLAYPQIEEPVVFTLNADGDVAAFTTFGQDFKKVKPQS